MRHSAEVILDASAILALIRNERGADNVAEALPCSAISAVNLAEVVSKLGAEAPGDRACLTESDISTARILTADRRWKKIPEIAARVDLIR